MKKSLENVFKKYNQKIYTDLIFPKKKGNWDIWGIIILQVKRGIIILQVKKGYNDFQHFFLY